MCAMTCATEHVHIMNYIKQSVFTKRHILSYNHTIMNNYISALSKDLIMLINKTGLKFNSYRPHSI